MANRRREARQVLRENTLVLIRHHSKKDGRTKDSLNHVATALKIPQKNLHNLTNPDKDVRLSTIESVACKFGLDAWQLLCPLPAESRDRILTGLALYSQASDRVQGAFDLAMRMARDEAQENL